MCISNYRVLGLLFSLFPALLVPAAAGLAADEVATLDTAEGDRYDISFLLHAQPGAKGDLRVFFARQDSGDGYVLQLSPRATVLQRATDGEARVLGRGPAPLPKGQSDALLVIRRRPAELSVNSGGRPLLRAWDAAYHTGSVAVASDEAGYRLDDLVVQPVAPAAFNDDFFQQPGRVSTWEPVRGTWQIRSYRDPMLGSPLAAASWYVGSGDQALSLTGYDFWDDYALEVSARPAQDAWAGLAACAQGSDDYLCFALRPGDPRGQVELFRVRQGVRRILAAGNADVSPERWYRLRLEAPAGSLRCFINDDAVLTAESPEPRSGRAGLYADGPGEPQFDDFMCRSLDSFADDFRSPLPGRWETATGQWGVGQGQLTGRAGSTALALVAERAWADCRVEALVAPGKGTEAGVVARAADERSCYRLGAGDGRWQLARVVGGAAQPLASGELDAPGPVRLAAELRGPQVRCFVADREVARAYDCSLAAGAAGVFVTGGRAAFRDFRVAQAEGELAGTVSLIRMEGETVIGPGHDETLPAIGYLWRPTPGLWRTNDVGEGNRALLVRSRGAEPALLWYRDPAPGQVAVQALLLGPLEGSAGLTICGDPQNPASGYRAEVSSAPPTLRLLRATQVVGQPVTLSEQALAGPAPLTLFRDGASVVAQVGGVGVVYTDPEPLPDGHCALWAAGDRAVFDDIGYANLDAVVYRFDRPQPDWRSSQGQWLVHSGMACIPWDYWITGVGDPAAFAWNGRPHDPDFVLDFNVSEYSEGSEDGRHQHFPYHDISVLCCGDGTDPDSGYHVVIATDGARVTKLLRQGEVVAQTDDPRFRVAMGSHCNAPRAINVRLQRRGGKLALFLQGVLALEYDDGDPLPPGLLGLGVANCSANFRDVVVYALGSGG